MRVRTFMCRKCAEEFTELDILEHEASRPQVDIMAMSPEERKEFIAKLFEGKTNANKPS